MKQCGTPKYEEWQQIVHLPNFKVSLYFIKPTFPKFIKAERKYTNMNLLGQDLL